MYLPWVSNIRSTFSVLLAFFLLSGCSLLQPLPEGLSYRGHAHPVADVQLLSDRTYIDQKGERQVEQEIFDEAFAIIGNAKRFILVDMFLYNRFQGAAKETIRALSSELTQRLIAQKRKHPRMEIVVITDPVNTVYGGLPSENFRRLREAGISVTMTKLEKLRDSNPLYSTIWRIFLQPFGNGDGSLLPNPFGDGRVSLRSYLRLLNFKANHRKVLIADAGDNLVGLVTSANPHDGSSTHGNVAVKFSGAAVNDLLSTERAVLAFSNGPELNVTLSGADHRSEVTLQVLTEQKIKEAVLQCIKQAMKGDRLDLAMFYLSERQIITALKQAHRREVNLRILLDPNKDAFGRAKNGIPNRQVAHELVQQGIPIRWCDTHGEQCHAKMLLITYEDRHSTLILGSANFTRRNLDNLNLETDVAIRGPTQAKVFTDAKGYFNLIWQNTPDQTFSVDYHAFEEKSFFKTLLYRFMEATGISTF